MSFYDFLVKFWWLELLALMGISYALSAHVINFGTGILAVLVSFILFILLSKSGLE